MTGRRIVTATALAVGSLNWASTAPAQVPGPAQLPVGFAAAAGVPGDSDPGGPMPEGVSRLTAAPRPSRFAPRFAAEAPGMPAPEGMSRLAPADRAAYRSRFIPDGPIAPAPPPPALPSVVPPGPVDPGAGPDAPVPLGTSGQWGGQPSGQLIPQSRYGSLPSTPPNSQGKMPGTPGVPYAPPAMPGAPNVAPTPPPSPGGEMPPIPSPTQGAQPTAPTPDTPPTAPQPGEAPAQPAPPPAVPPAVDAATAPGFEPLTSTPGSQYAAATAVGGAGFGGVPGGGSYISTPPMLGDMSSLRFHALASTPPTPPSPPPPIPPTPPSARVSTPPYPTVRSFKISENMSPRPQDRVFFDFNYYTDVNRAINKFDQIAIKNMTAYRWLFGLEKTFNDGKGSVGLRLPLNTITADPTRPDVLTPTSTALGNLSIFGKYILEEDKATGSLASVGLVVTPPTGPSRFGNAPYVYSINSITFQPFFGWIINRNRFYVQGFSAFDFPANLRDVTLMYNDVGFGYYLLRSPDPNAFLTAVAPTFEVHVNNPLTHRHVYTKSDPVASPDVVNLTYGVNFEFRRSALLTVGLVTPVTSPKPFETELAVLLNIYFGRTRQNRMAITPPPVL